MDTLVEAALGNLAAHCNLVGLRNQVGNQAGVDIQAEQGYQVELRQEAAQAMYMVEDLLQRL